jgi:hypothetical protein
MAQKAWGRKEAVVVYVRHVQIKHVRDVTVTYAMDRAIGISTGSDICERSATAYM